MKKLLLTAVYLIITSMTANAISVNKAMLSHNGEVTLFDDLQNAISSSADGDTIYLTLGTFKGPIIVDKMITIRGTGETSIINGDVDILIPNTPTLTAPVLEALSVSGTVNVGAQVDAMILRKCKIAKFDINATVDRAVLDRCYITSMLTLSQFIKGMTVVNSKLMSISGVSGTTSNTTFVNCNIDIINPYNFSGTIVNSIIRTCNDGGNYRPLKSSVVLNSLHYNIDFASSSVTQNCYKSTFNLSSDCECSLSTSNLQSNGYLGTDGTVVGIYGGETPYTLVPSVPKVTSSELRLDNEKKELNVKLTVSPQ